MCTCIYVFLICVYVRNTYVRTYVRVQMYVLLSFQPHNCTPQVHLQLHLLH